MSMEFDADNVTAPRLVEMKRSAGGYGFNLHGERNVQAGQSISAVDDGSEAQKAGLRVGDKVVEVNGKNVEKVSHGDVVKQIKINAESVTMLVIDHITDAYLKQEGRPITVDMANLMTVYQEKEVATEPEAPQPTFVVEDSVAEVPESNVEDSEPPPTQPAAEITNDDTVTTEAEIAVEATTPEEVKQLNEVLDKEDAAIEDVEAPVTESVPEPEPVAPQTNGMENHEAKPEPTPEPSPEPTPPAPTPAPVTAPPRPASQPSRPTSKPLRSTIKQQKTESWDEKYKKFQQL